MVFASYERFEELMNMYPLGDGVYSQNLAADRGIKLLLRAERYQQAIELYYKHQFGYHIGEMLDPLAAGLWQAKRLDLLYKVLDDEYVRADEYRYTGAYIRCMEGGASGGLPAGEEICRKKKKKSYRHRALELFDSNAYVNCMFIKDKKTKDLCLDELERRYRASGKELTEEQLVEDMYSYSAVLVVLRYWGMMGDPRPDLIPSQTFVNSDFKDVRAIAGVIAGLLLIEEREAAMNLLDKAIEAKLESLKEKKTGIAGALSNISNNAGADFEQWATYAFFDAVKQLNDADGLGEVITDSPKEVVDYFALENARLKLLIEEDRSQEVLSFLKRIPRSSKSHPGSITPSSLLRLASLATMKKNDELATDLYKLSEQAYCELPLDDKETSNLHYLKKHLVFRGVRDGLLPSWASHDLRH